MYKIIEIAKWEFLEKVKTKSFLLYMILFPTILFSISLLPNLMDENEDVSKTIGIIDYSQSYAPTIHNIFNDFKLSNGGLKYLSVDIPEVEYRLLRDKQFIRKSHISAVVSIKDIDDKTNIEFEQYGFLTELEIHNIMSTARLGVKEVKLRGLNITADQYKNLKSSIVLTHQDAEFLHQEDVFLNTFFSSYLFILLFILMIIFSGGQLIRSLVEEKSSRIIEVLLSSCTMKELLLGKILGLTLLGIFQLFVWSIIIGGINEASALNFSLMDNLKFQLVFFVLGYILFASIFIGAGALISTEQEAQHVTSYISISLIFPILFSVQVLGNPHSLLSSILTYFPLTTAPTMILKLNASQPDYNELLLTSGCLLFSIYLVITLTSKVFGKGILSFSRRPRFNEIKQWIFKEDK